MAPSSRRVGASAGAGLAARKRFAVIGRRSRVLAPVWSSARLEPLQDATRACLTLPTRAEGATDAQPWREAERATARRAEAAWDERRATIRVPYAVAQPTRAPLPSVATPRTSRARTVASSSALAAHAPITREAAM